MRTQPLNGHSERESQERYEEYRSEENAALRRAWEGAPESFKKAARARGLELDIEQREGVVLEFNETHPSTAYIPDVAADIDTHIDRLIEKYGAANEGLIRAISQDLQEPMRREIEQSRGLMLGRIACYLAKGESTNVMARIHAILHSIPRLAIQVGYTSLRHSSRECGCSVEWLRKKRDQICHELGLPIPVDAQKKPEAKRKYKEAALGIGFKPNGEKYSHWRKQIAGK